LRTEKAEQSLCGNARKETIKAEGGESGKNGQKGLTKRRSFHIIILNAKDVGKVAIASAPRELSLKLVPSLGLGIQFRIHIQI